jgi:hypothetical protein
MSDQKFYSAIRNERRRVSYRQAIEQIGEVGEALNRLLFGEGRVPPDAEPDEDRVVSARRLMSVRQNLKRALRTLKEAEE